MSFFEATSYLINPRITLYMNDIMFIMVVCFYVGRLYERRRLGKYLLIDTGKLGIGNESQFTASAPFATQKVERVDQSAIQRLQEQIPIKNEQQRLHANNQVTLEQSPPDLALKNEIVSQVKSIDDDNLVSSLQVFDSDKLSKSRLISKNQKQSEPIYQGQNQLLIQRIKLEGQKIQENGKIYINFEFSKENSNFIRKIQKHEIITDYIVKKQSLLAQHGQFQLVPLKKQLSYPNQSSAIEVEYYQNYSSGKKIEPIVHKRIIELNEKTQMYINSFIEHGKFRKLYRNILKIGEGGFGTVYQAYHLLQSKKYAVKKIFINKMSKQIENLLNQIKILNTLSHPNIVKYNSCWLEYAEFNQHKQYQRMLQRYNKNSKNNGAISIKINEDQNQDQEEVNQSEFQQSYISDGSNGFSFARSSKQPTKKSIPQLKKKDSTKLLKKQDHKIISENQKQNNFGFMPVMYIQMQLCEHSLAYYLRKREEIDRVFCYQIMAQLIGGVGYIHLNRIVHRDLKPQNILFAANSQTLTVKIGDFGLAVQMEGKGQEKSLMLPSTPAGTPSYIAPQLYSSSTKKLNQDELQKTDIYSLAVIYYEMLNKFSTSHQRGQKLSSLKYGKVPGITEFKQEKKLIQQLIKHNRPNAKQMMQMQSWKKLTQTIHKLKRKMYKNYCVTKKDSNSTNHTSNYSEQSQSKLSQNYDEILRKQVSMSKSRSKTNKNKFRQAYDLKKGALDQDQQLIDNQQCFNSTYRNKDGDQFQCNQQEIQHELYRQNILIIKRANSRGIKTEGSDGNIGHITEQDDNSREERAHPEMEKQADEEQ